MEGRNLPTTDTPRKDRRVRDTATPDRTTVEVDPAELSAADAIATGMPLSGVKLELRVAEIEAELDALTGGAFTRLSRRHETGAGVGDP